MEYARADMPRIDTGTTVPWSEIFASLDLMDDEGEPIFKWVRFVTRTQGSRATAKPSRAFCVVPLEKVMSMRSFVRQHVPRLLHHLVFAT